MFRGSGRRAEYTNMLVIESSKYKHDIETKRSRTKVRRA
jgi:hypothetical protein